MDEDELDMNVEPTNSSQLVRPSATLNVPISHRPSPRTSLMPNRESMGGAGKNLITPTA